jgi:hypothetical protein
MESEFERFLDAVRRGHGHDAEDLARKLAPYLRRVIHLRLTNRKLRQVLDSMDICQSTLAFFLANANSRWAHIKTERELQHLLVAIAVSKLRSRARHEERRLSALPENWDPADESPDPYHIAAGHDLESLLRSRFTDEEWWLFDQHKLQRRSWPEITLDYARRPEALLGTGPDGLRIRLTRAIARVRRELGKGENHVRRANPERPASRTG